MARSGERPISRYSAKHRAALLGSYILLAGPQVADATEIGGTLRALGIDTARSGVMEPPGSARGFISLGYYEARNVRDGSGNDRPDLSNYRLTVESITTRLSYYWPAVDLLGAQVETRLAIPYLRVNVGFDAPGNVHVEGAESGWADLMLAPALLGWHTSRYHQIAGIALFAPTGDYEARAPVNPGRGYFGWAPIYSFSWYPADGLEVSGNLGYIFNSRNAGTNYTSGNEAGFDYGIGYSPNATWQLGVSGYIYKQTTGDKVDGRTVGDGNRGQAVAVGPFVRYGPNRNWGTMLKWQYETQVENRAQGNRIMLQFTHAL